MSSRASARGQCLAHCRGTLLLLLRIQSVSWEVREGGDSQASRAGGGGAASRTTAGIEESPERGRVAHPE